MARAVRAAGGGPAARPDGSAGEADRPGDVTSEAARPDDPSGVGSGGAPDGTQPGTIGDASINQLRTSIANLAARLADLATGSTFDGGPLVPALPVDGRLHLLAQRFQLSPVDLDLLLVAASPDLDARFAAVFAAGPGEPDQHRPSVGTAFEVCGLTPWSTAARERLGPGGPLIAHRLVEVEAEELPFPSRRLRVPDRVVAHLLGDDTIDAALQPLVAPLVPARVPGAAALAEAVAGGMWLSWIRERPRGSGFSLAATAFADAGMPAIAFDLRRGGDDARLATVLHDAEREATLRSAALVIGPIDPVRDGAAVATIGEPLCPVVLVSPEPWAPQWSSNVPFLADAIEVPSDVRAEVWSDALTRLGAPVDGAVDASTYRLAPDQIVVAAASAVTQAAAAGRPVSASDLASGARAHNAGHLERLVRRVTPEASFDDLVLTEPQLRDLKEVLDRVRTRDLVRLTWRMGGSHHSRGVTCLFSGPSGTGKTLSAEALATGLGVDLYVIDLSQVVDKYIGETEKNLERIFADAEGVNGLLFFDEADALFGKRSDVRDAHDRHANIEVAYLLQRMEQFDGIAVLATNLQAHLDDAFTRRIDVIIHFNKPSEDERGRLWRLHLPATLPQADDIDLPFLAKAFDVTGGIIRNITLAAAHAAAADGRAVDMADLVRATARDHQKRGRLLNIADFGPYSHVLDK